MKKNCEYINLEPWFDPVDLYEKKIVKCEMSYDDLGFLCGLLKKNKPRKIVEVGVAEGGTTAIIVKALNTLNYETTMYSVDITPTFYADNTLPTGFEFLKISKDLGNLCNHEFLFGKSLAGQIENIGNNIDFAILDTTHALPGEVLDILTILPYMSSNGIIVLHDVELSRLRAIEFDNPWKHTASFAIATKIALLTVSSSEKYLNTDYTGINGAPLANIAAFKVDNSTKANPYNLFYTLTLPWAYHLPENLINEYSRIFKKHYDSTCNDCFDSAITYSDIFDEIWK